MVPGLVVVGEEAIPTDKDRPLLSNLSNGSASGMILIECDGISAGVPLFQERWVGCLRSEQIMRNINCLQSGANNEGR